jgi:hypothetical protein
MVVTWSSKEFTQNPQKCFVFEDGPTGSVLTDDDDDDDKIHCAYLLRKSNCYSDD